MHISQEKLDEFQERMSDWVASQGLLFQLRHGGAVEGAQSSAAAWVLRIGIRLGVFLLVALLLVGGYLVKRTDFAGFRADLNERIAVALGAESAVAGGIKRSKGRLEIAQISLVGGEESFFEGLAPEELGGDAGTDGAASAPATEAEEGGADLPEAAKLFGVSTKMGLLDGVLGAWNGETIRIERMEMFIKSGVEDESLGRAMFGRIFEQLGRFQFSRIEVQEATLRWGYSGVTAGGIEKSRLVATRRDYGWSIVVKGGLFSQNWLSDLPIEEMSLKVTPEGLEFEKAVLKRDGEELSFTARITGPTTRPEISGQGRFVGLKVDTFLPVGVREWVSATLSGDATFGGSPYASTGVTMKVEVTCDEGEVTPGRIDLRGGQVFLFKAISVVDRLRSYKTLRFRSGGFTLQTGGEVAVISNLSLVAEDVLRVEGEFLARPPTLEEVEKAMAAGAGRGAGEREELALQDTVVGEELSLDDLAEQARTQRREETLDDEYRFNPRTSEYLALETAARNSLKATPWLRGRIRVGLNAQAFERAPELVEKFPIHPDNQLRWLDVPVNGFFNRAGEKLGEDIIALSGSDK